MKTLKTILPILSATWLSITPLFLDANQVLSKTEENLNLDSKIASLPDNRCYDISIYQNPYANKAATQNTENQGSTRDILDFADSYALMPPDNQSPISGGGDISSPSKGRSGATGATEATGPFFSNAFAYTFSTGVIPIGDLYFVTLATNEPPGVLLRNCTIDPVNKTYISVDYAGDYLINVTYEHSCGDFGDYYISYYNKSQWKQIINSCIYTSYNGGAATAIVSLVAGDEVAITTGSSSTIGNTLNVTVTRIIPQRNRNAH